MKKHVTIKVIGKVQGVFFRASAADMAKALGLKGFVKNERDGSVYIEAEGQDEELAQLEEWCKYGPPAAKVDHLEINEGEIKNFDNFSISR